MRMKHVVAALAVVVCVSSISWADNIEPGVYDLPPQSITVDLQIPADFFGPGSDPVNESSLELTSYFLRFDLRDAASLPNCGDVVTPSSAVIGGFDTLPNFLTVTYNGGQNPEVWDVGYVMFGFDEMTIHHDCPEGGTYEASLTGDPFIEFLGPSGPFFLDLPAQLETVITGGWSHTGVGPGNFFAGDVPPNCTCPPTGGGDIPTVSEWGIATLALLLLIGGKVYFARRRAIA